MTLYKIRSTWAYYSMDSRAYIGGLIPDFYVEASDHDTAMCVAMEILRDRSGVEVEFIASASPQNSEKREGPKITVADLEQGLHRHEKGDGSWWAEDAQGIELCRVCDDCEEAALSRYRPEIIEGYNQGDVDEPIEPED